MAPGISGPDTTRWTARHNTGRAHTKAWHSYDKEFRAGQAGSVGITLNTDWVPPITNSTNDQKAADSKNAFDLGFWADPIYSTGAYPDIVKETLSMLNVTLPKFTQQEIEKNKG